MFGLLSAMPGLFLYEAIPVGFILVGVALIVWVLTSLGSRRSRRRRRVALLTGGFVGGFVLVLFGFFLALARGS